MNNPICPHFGVCGGCSFQDIPYEKQLENKVEQIKSLMEKNGISAPLKPINHFEPLYYRNKMEFTFAQDQSNLLCGFHSRQTREVFDLKECRIFSPDTGAILDAAREFCREKGYCGWDKYGHHGQLRHLIVRESKTAGQMMIGMVIAGDFEFDRQGFVKILTELKLASPVASIYLIHNDSWGDAVTFQKKELLYGEPYIKETLDGLVFNIGIDTFFQVNSKAIGYFYSKIRDYADLDDSRRVLDLFCGVGSIGMFLSKKAKFVWGVELTPAIVDAAWENAKANNISNISFFASDARKFVNTQGSFYRDSEVLVINPPRCGIAAKMRRAIKEKLFPQIIFYSSCNPATLFEDLKELSQGYSLEFVEPFDFFPHTPHVECLTMMRKV